MEPALKLVMNNRILIVGCLEFVVYFQYTSVETVRDFLERSFSALGHRLTHYIAESMRRHAEIRPAVHSMLETWLTRPRQGRRYWMELRGSGPGEGCSESSIIVSLYPREKSVLSPEQEEQLKESNRRMYEVAKSKFMPPVTTLRVTLPLDHELAIPTAFREWVMNFHCVRSGQFAAGHAGLAINIDDAVSDSASRSTMQAKMAALLLRHPGLDWENLGSVTMHLPRYIPGQVEFVPQFKRVQWLTMVRDETLSLCSGREAVLKTLAEAPEIDVHPVENGIVIQAGPQPELGDVTKWQYLPAYRKVAKVLAPARIAEHDGRGREFPPEAAQKWLEAFERDYD